MRICGIEGCERKQRRLGLCPYHFRRTPEYKEYQKEYYTRPEVKARAKIRNEIFRMSPKGKAWIKAYYQTPEQKKKAREYLSRPETKIKRKGYLTKYNSSLEGSVWRLNYMKEYNSRPEVKASRKVFYQTPEQKIKAREYRKLNPEVNLKAKQKLFKRLSKILGYPPKQIPMLYKGWADTIKKLDDYICKNCGSVENLEAHHIIPISHQPEISLDEDNGITLCRRCHSQTHHQPVKDII